MYSELLLDHFHHPRNVGEIAEATAVVEASNPVCGDLMKLWAVARDGKILEEGPPADVLDRPKTERMATFLKRVLG